MNLASIPSENSFIDEENFQFFCDYTQYNVEPKKYDEREIQITHFAIIF